MSINLLEKIGDPPAAYGKQIHSAGSTGQAVFSFSTSKNRKR